LKTTALICELTFENLVKDYGVETISATPGIHGTAGEPAHQGAREATTRWASTLSSKGNFFFFFCITLTPRVE